MYELLADQVADGVTNFYDITAISQDYATLRVVVSGGSNYNSVASEDLGIIPIMSDGVLVNGTGTRVPYRTFPMFRSNNAIDGTYGFGLYVGLSDSVNDLRANAFSVWDFHMYSINAAGTLETAQNRQITAFGNDELSRPRTANIRMTPRDNSVNSPATATITGLRFCNPTNTGIPILEGARITVYGRTLL